MLNKVDTRIAFKLRKRESCWIITIQYLVFKGYTVVAHDFHTLVFLLWQVGIVVLILILAAEAI